jgi:hypothetical protein
MKNTVTLLLLGALGGSLAGIAASAPAPTKRAPSTAAPRPGLGPAGPASGPIQPKTPPDLAVASVVIELVSTTKGQPGVEFPADKLKISGIVMDIGGTKSPASFRVKLVKNASQVLATKTIPAPTAPGQSWTLVHADTYVHGPAPLYQIVVEADYTESSTTNNKRGLALKDDVLHSQGRQESTDTSALPGGVQVPGGISIFF